MGICLLGDLANPENMDALARKLAITLWRYLETGLIPEGASLKARQRRRRQRVLTSLITVGGLDV